jgi:zinc protease
MSECATVTNRVKKVQEAKGIVEYQLDNGLKILLAENHSAPVVTFMALFRVGSRNEAVGYTGATHFLEHMMFKGTKEHNSQKGNSLDELMRPLGALMNATTWLDRTNYFECVPAEHLELCVKLEADRMRNLRLRQEDHDSEMTVVRQEMEQGEDNPGRVLMKELFAIAFREHPYHHPTIGWRSDVEGVPMSRLQQFYDDFYWPDNATVFVSGDFEPEKALALIEKYYGVYPAAPKAIPAVYTIEPPQQGERRFELHRKGDAPHIWMGYRVPHAAHADTYALAVIESILSGASSSRLPKALVQTRLAVSASNWHARLRDPGLSILMATAAPDVELPVIEKALLTEIERLISEPVEEDELARVKQAMRKRVTLRATDPFAFCSALAEGEAAHDWRWLMEFNDNVDKVRPEDIQRVAAAYFKSTNATVGYFIPLKEGEEEKIAALLDNKADLKEAHGAEAAQAEAAENEEAGSDTDDASAPGATALCEVSSTPGATTAKPRGVADSVLTRKLANGLLVQYLPNRGTGTVAVSVKVRAGSNFSSVEKPLAASLVAALLSEGSNKYTKDEISQIGEGMGVGGISFGADTFEVSTKDEVVVEDFPALMAIYNNVLRHPVFPEEHFLTKIVRYTSFFERQATENDAVARQALTSALYPPHHPYGSPSFEELKASLKDVTLGDLQVFHQEHYTPEGTVLTIVGDIEAEQAFAVAEQEFGDWAGPTAKPILVEAVPLVPSCEKRQEIYMPGKATVAVMYGVPVTVKRDSPEFYAAMIANHALGGSTLGTRLGREVREKRGLTYGIRSNFRDLRYGVGSWRIGLSTPALKVEEALAVVDTTLKEYRASGISEKELKNEAGCLIGEFVLQLRTSLGLASVLGSYAFMDMDISEIDTYAQRMKAVTQAEADAVIAKHLSLDNAVVVTCGTLVNQPS